MRKSLAGIMLSASIVMTSHAACPDYVSAANPPTLAGHAKRPFSNFGNILLSSYYKPWHMAHDVIVKAGAAATMEAKFDYDIVLHKANACMPTCTAPA